MMTMIKLVGKQFRSLHFGILPLVMLTALTVRTFMSSGAVMLSGLCVVFLPYFTQIRKTTALDDTISEEKYIFSRYLMYLLLITAGMLYLKGVTYLGSALYAGYTASPIAHDLFLLTYLCDLAFISVLLPLTFALGSQQKLMTAAVLSNIAIGFMVLAAKLLTLAGPDFILRDQWGLYVLAVMLPLLSLGAVAAGGVREKKQALRTENSR